ncbi:MAG TPA: DUF488 domain-containing protein [Solirubrobacterales bacterium]|jgi:uncharacterized protein (DUF488 family)|nr:DUF488 domain-containing protein [Solirubrobacterales bacterium]
MAPGAEILTVGHSNHSERAFLELLRGAGVETLVDVRRNPRSRYEHFNRSALAGSLQAAGVDYVHLGEELGGRRAPLPDSANKAWDEEAFRGYADHMAGEEFAAGLARLEQLSAERRVAILCAEGDWHHCHRRLIADALAASGRRVLHLGPEGSLAEHELTETAVVTGDSVTYPEVQTSLDV